MTTILHIKKMMIYIVGLGRLLRTPLRRHPGGSGQRDRGPQGAFQNMNFLGVKLQGSINHICHDYFNAYYCHITRAEGCKEEELPAACAKRPRRGGAK